MSGIRFSSIPRDHLLGELAAYPLATVAALRFPVESLDANLEGPTRYLWRQAEKDILHSAPGFAVDEAVAIRDQLWFDDIAGSSQSLDAYLGKLARSFLQVRGSAAVPLQCLTSHARATAAHAAEASSRVAWRWISFALPPDLLLAALDNRRFVPTRVELTSHRLRTHLRDQGYAEIHLHAAAGIDFSQLWCGLVLQIGDPETKVNSFQSPGADLNEGRELGPWLLRGSIARWVLGCFLKRRRSAESLMEFLDRLGRSSQNGSAFCLLRLCLSEICHGKIEYGEGFFAELQELYRSFSLVGLRAYRLRQVSIRRVSDLWRIQEADPLSAFYPVSSSDAPSPEMSYITAALAYLGAGTTRDWFFARLFWQTVRIRCIFYRHTVQRPLIPGLQWFIRHYDRMRVARRPIRRFRVACSARLCGLGNGLKSLELRARPKSSLGDNLVLIDAWLRQAAEISRSLEHLGTSPPCEFGIVFHFSRERGGRDDEGAPPAFERSSHGDPGVDWPYQSTNPTGYRYATIYKRYREEAISLAGVLCRFPASLAVVRGLDACTDEFSVPLWVLAPIFRYLEGAAEIASHYVRDAYGLSIPTLKKTIHTGEDFVHILSGLRTIHQTIDVLGLKEGDRIGHGLALGLDAGDWARRVGSVPMRRGERLTDLVWEWSWYGREKVSPSLRRRLYVEREIARLSAAIFDYPVKPFTLELFFKALQSEEVLRLVGFPDGPRMETGTRMGLRGVDNEVVDILRLYLTNHQVFVRAKKVEWVEAESGAEVFSEIQDRLRQMISGLGIAVEVNPTSNLLIGDLSDLSHHPLWRLHLPRPGASPPLSVCIGSDDPLTFTTDLLGEYQFVHDSLVLAGLSDEEAIGWLNKARRCGLEHRFTLPPELLGRLRQSVGEGFIRSLPGIPLEQLPQLP